MIDWGKDKIRSTNILMVLVFTAGYCINTGIVKKKREKSERI